MILPVVGRETYLPGARRIALVAPQETYVGPEPAAVVFGLLERGWDAHLVFDDGAPRRQPLPPAIEPLARAGRLHQGAEVTRRLRRRRTAAEHLRVLDPQLI